MSFAIALTFLYELEGGFTDLDGGTNRGITLGYLQSIEEDVNSDGVIDILDIEVLSNTAISHMYFKDYWQPNKLNKITNQDIATRLFVAIVHTGQKSAITLMQLALCDCKYEVKIDGIIGPETLNAINNTHPKKLLKAFRVRLIAYYQRITKLRTKKIEAGEDLTDFRDYLDGWVSRALK